MTALLSIAAMHLDSGTFLKGLAVAKDLASVLMPSVAAIIGWKGLTTW